MTDLYGFEYGVRQTDSVQVGVDAKGKPIYIYPPCYTKHITFVNNEHFMEKNKSIGIQETDFFRMSAAGITHIKVYVTTPLKTMELVATYSDLAAHHTVANYGHGRQCFLTDEWWGEQNIRDRKE